MYQFIPSQINTLIATHLHYTEFISFGLTCKRIHKHLNNQTTAFYQSEARRLFSCPLDIYKLADTCKLLVI